MERRYRITVDGHPYTVTVEELGDTGNSLYPTPGSMQVPSVSQASTVAAAAAPATPPVVETAAGSVVSSLGGMVEHVHVAVGDMVAAGDTLVTVEAMKMKNAIVAPGAGKVASVLVKAGDTVDAGHVLLTLA